MMNIPPPARQGTYLLIVRLPRPTRLQVDKLGTFDLPTGHYVYAGSALGPGGLSARVARHLAANRSLHWHIDYLLRAGIPQEVWYVELNMRLECAWARTVATLPGAFRPIPHFGASDCRCPGHLVALPHIPDDTSFGAALVNTLPISTLRIGRWVLAFNPAGDTTCPPSGEVHDH